VDSRRAGSTSWGQVDERSVEKQFPPRQRSDDLHRSTAPRALPHHLTEAARPSIMDLIGSVLLSLDSSAQSLAAEQRSAGTL
jgi:hypothetical protein